MPEIYRNTSQYVHLDIHGANADSTPTAKVGTTSLVVSGPQTVDGAQRWTTNLSLAQTQNAGEVSVVWNFNINGQAASKVDHFDVVVPLVSIAEVRDALGIDEDEYMDSEILKAERRVRVMIENATGQVFAPTHETLYASSSGDNYLRLPKRLISTETYFLGALNEGYRINYPNLRISDDGFKLIASAYRAPDIIVAHEQPIWESGGVIRDPYSWANQSMRGGRAIPVTGTWGWERVPREISEAALILIEQQLTPESLYREKYLVSMTAADWRIQFDSGAYRGTGNVVADQILAAFQISNMAVI